MIRKYRASSFSVRCRAFSVEGVRENRVKVDSDGHVWVYDDVAGHYVCNHSIAASTIGKIRRLAQVSS